MEVSVIIKKISLFFLPHLVLQEIDKSLDNHLIPNDLDFAMKQAPNMVECLELPISL